VQVICFVPDFHRRKFFHLLSPNKKGAKKNASRLKSM
jgi:hypothetical protein